MCLELAAVAIFVKLAKHFNGNEKDDLGHGRLLGFENGRVNAASVAGNTCRPRIGMHERLMAVALQTQ